MLTVWRCHPSSRVMDLINLWPATSPTIGSSRGRRSLWPLPTQISRCCFACAGSWSRRWPLLRAALFGALVIDWLPRVGTRKADSSALCADVLRRLPGPAVRLVRTRPGRLRLAGRARLGRVVQRGLKLVCRSARSLFWQLAKNWYRTCASANAAYSPPAIPAG